MAINLPEHLVNQPLALSVEQRTALMDELRLSLLSEEDAAMVWEHLPKWQASWQRFLEDPDSFPDAYEVLDELEAELDAKTRRAS